jgi:hypothetical protein
MSQFLGKLSKALRDVLGIAETLRGIATAAYAIVLTTAMVIGLILFVSSLVHGAVNPTEFLQGLRDFFIHWFRMVEVA